MSKISAISKGWKIIKTPGKWVDYDRMMIFEAGRKNAQAEIMQLEMQSETLQEDIKKLGKIDFRALYKTQCAKIEAEEDKNDRDIDD